MCCDGTGNEYGTNNTNVVIAYALAEESAQQCRYYDPGVGTGGWVYEEDAGTLRAAMDQATGHGLRKNVEDAYRFLMQAYEDDDRVYLFGFSRGAFTVRSLAGMLHRCGLLRPTAANLVEYASKLYHQEDGDNGGEEVDAGFRATFARPCPVHFIGVWDTVESLILNAGRKWHDTRLSPETAFAYQALAIDERRSDFPPCLWDESSRAAHQALEQVWFCGRALRRRGLVRRARAVEPRAPVDAGQGAGVRPASRRRGAAASLASGRSAGDDARVLRRILAIPRQPAARDPARCAHPSQRAHPHVGPGVGLRPEASEESRHRRMTTTTHESISTAVRPGDRAGSSVA